jgi:hypothetical protein
LFARAINSADFFAINHPDLSSHHLSWSFRALPTFGSGGHAHTCLIGKIFEKVERTEKKAEKFSKSRGGASLVNTTHLH